MKRIRIIGLALVAMFALSAVVASAASAALPEFGGKIGQKVKFTSGEGLLETVGKRQIKCKSDKGEGELSSAKSLLHVIIIFSGCKSIGFLKEAECNSAGQPGGTIAIFALLADVVYLNKATKEVGFLGKPETGTTIAEFECHTLIAEKIKVTGESLGKYTSAINKPLTLLTVEAKCNTGKPIPSEYENEKGEKVKVKTETTGSGGEAFGPEESCLQGAEDALTAGAEPIEIKA